MDRLDGYHMIIEHRVRDKHQNADSLKKKLCFIKDWSINRPIRRKSNQGRTLVSGQRDLRSTSLDKMVG